MKKFLKKSCKFCLLLVTLLIMSITVNAQALSLTYTNDSFLKTGWMYSADDEWTMSFGGTGYSLVVAPDGNLVSANTVTASYHVRPVFFLESDVELASGDGSSSNPYVIQTESSDDEEEYYVYFTGDVDKIVFSYNGLEDTEITEYGLYSVSLSNDASISLNSDSGCTYFTLSVINTVDGETVDSFSTLTSLDSSYYINSSIDVTAGDNYEIYVTAYGCLSLFS